MSDTSTGAGTYEDKSKGLESSASFVKQWLDALARAEDEEKDWTKKAEETAEIYRGKKKRARNFNILHSNVETLCPALYNSTPVPDVRRRFNDPDPVAKIVADILERALSFSLDNYDFDAVMKAIIRDAEVVGRGVPRVRYVPSFGEISGEDGEPQIGDDGQPLEQVVAEEVTSEYVPWRYFRRGPGRTWADIPWVAFGDLLTREDLRKLCGDAVDKNGKPIADEVPLNHGSEKRKTGQAEPSIFARALVWQFWDKDNRRVVSICPDYADAPLAMVEDPLGLVNFFPIPRPYQPVLCTDSLVPVVPYEIYEDLVLELNDVTGRIAKLVKQMRPRGLWAGDAKDIAGVANADDGELIPVTDADKFIQQKGLESAISWFPLDPTVKALNVLVTQRNEIKQVIYEVTGIADILRGATNPNETLGAQQIKAQWGSLRVQDRQAEVARLARDVLRLKGEIIASKFSWETLSAMTGIDAPSKEQQDAARAMIAQAMQAQQQPAPQAPMGHNGGPPMAPQPGPDAGAMPPDDGGGDAPGPGMASPMPAPAAPVGPPMQPSGPPPAEAITDEMKAAAQGPTREEILEILRSDVTRRYRTDIESDSTVRGDLARNQQVMTSFLQGTAQFAQAMGPIIMQFPQMLKPAMAVYGSFARQFKLGKQAEDALDQLSEAAGEETAPKPPQEDPKLQADKFRAAAAMKQTEMDMTVAKAKHGMDMEKLVAEGERDKQKFAMQQGPIDLPRWPYNPSAPTAVNGAPPLVPAQ